MPGTSDVRIIDQRSPEERDRPFLPGMGRIWLLPFYDLVSRADGVAALHERAVEVAGVAPGHAVVDVGCGTANLSFAVLAAQPDARVTGLDPDLAALRRAARKARRRGVPLTLVQGYADAGPAPDASLDHVVSALALHHLDDDGRVAFARDAFRALRPAGKITIVDFAGEGHAHGGAHDGEGAHDHGHGHGPAHALQHLRAFLPRRSVQGPTLTSNVDNGIADLLTAAGFSGAREVDHVDHRLGRVAFVQAIRPADAPPAR